MFPHINHPNFVWAMTAEDLIIALEGEQFFEVYNGHPASKKPTAKGERPGMELHLGYREHPPAPATI